MIRELFHLGPISISPFGVLMVLAFLSAYWQLRRCLKRSGLGTDEDAGAILFAAGLGGIVGAKIYYAALYGDWKLLLERWGFVWYGGLILGGLAVLWVVRRHGLPMWRMLDFTTVSLALGYAIGRIGCFLVGDDYGIPSTLPWAVAFPVGLPPTRAGLLRSEFGLDIPASVSNAELLSVHPTQLYETALALLIWGAGLMLLRRRPTAGLVGLSVLLLLAIERFGIEFLRAKDDRWLGSLTVAQGISLALIVLLAATWFLRRRHAEELGAGEQASA